MKTEPPSMAAGESDQSQLMKFSQLIQGNETTPGDTQAPSQVPLQRETFGCNIEGPFEYVGTLEVSTEVITIFSSNYGNPSF